LHGFENKGSLTPLSKAPVLLADNEFKDLSKPWDWSLLTKLGSRLHVMGCEADTWLSRNQFDDMCARIPGIQATWHPNLRHDFCICVDQSKDAAKHVNNILAKYLTNM
jgi:hypothetical protein